MALDSRAYNGYVNIDGSDQQQDPVKERSPYLFCDVCMHYPMEPVHGHFYCPSCHNATKCCELGPMTLEGAAH